MNLFFGAGEGSRTPVNSLESCGNTVIRHPLTNNYYKENFKFVKIFMKIKKKYIIILIVLMVLSLSFLFKGEKEEPFNFSLVQRNDIKEEVDVVGRVEPAQRVDLSFEKGGRVEKIMVSISDEVVTGEEMIFLNDQELKSQINQTQASLESAQSSLAQYQAALESAEASLSELKRGARSEEIKLAETKVANAEKTLINAQTNLLNVKEKAQIDIDNLYEDVKDILNSAYFYADDAINRQITDIFSSASSDNPDLSFLTSDSQARIDCRTKRVEVGKDLKEFKSLVDSFPLDDQFVLDQYLDQGEKYLIDLRIFLNRVNDALNSAIDVSSATLSTYKTGINTARTNVNTTLANINTQKQTILSQKVTNQNNIVAAENSVIEAESLLTLAEDELILKKLGATEEQIKVQEAAVTQAQANVEAQKAKIRQIQAEKQSLQTQIEKTVLMAPFSGIIVEQKAKVGEIILANTPVVSIISQDNFEIKANVPEADIAKIKINNLANITLDAYSRSEIFLAEVVSINPVEKMIEGLATYEVKLHFLEQDSRIKSGMTADINIITAEQKNVLTIPSRAVIQEKQKKYVQILNPLGEVEKIEVETGLKGITGQIEIISGLNEGEQVIIP